jgi:hypothetical protein
MATLLKVLDNLADIKSAGGVALGLGTQAIDAWSRYNRGRRRVSAWKLEMATRLDDKAASDSTHELITFAGK